MREQRLRLGILATLLMNVGPVSAADLGKVPQYKIQEIVLIGSTWGPKDAPVREVQLALTFRHESGVLNHCVQGFWDGDGKGGTTGDVFKVRFCPTKPGHWTIVKTESNDEKLRGQREGDGLTCVESSHPGFWIAEGRWYRRSDDSHPYILGNTHYSFLSQRRVQDHPGGPTVEKSPIETIQANARYYKKLRFSLTGDRYPDPTLKPFLDKEGRPSDDGNLSFRPNPTWFSQRVDPVIREGYAQDLICDLILCGPDTQDSRSTLKGDPKPWVRYLAARYGSYPHVWFCLCNEWNIKNPRYTHAEIRTVGEYLTSLLPHPTPVSVHSNTGPWDKHLNGKWHDHVIIQHKLKIIARAADAAEQSFLLGGRKPVINDENAYEGKGDRFSKEDTIEGCFGTFLGGGYPTTGSKPGAKLGQYFWGGFDVKEHPASTHLVYLRQYIDKTIDFWRLQPLTIENSLLANVPSEFRLLGQTSREYVLGSNRPVEGITLTLPEGNWRITQVDLINLTTRTLAENATGTFKFSTPASRAVLTHARKSEAALPSPKKPLPGQIILDPGNPAHLVYNRDNNRDGKLDPVFIAGPGDPEDFLYRGTLNPDGTRKGDQMELIDKLKKQGGNCIYLQAVRSHGGDGERTHNPFVGHDPKKGLNRAVIEQWEQWFQVMDEAGIVIYFFFYDDSARPFGNKGDELPQAEREFIHQVVRRFQQHKHLIWCVAEEYHEAFTKARMSNFAAEIRQTDDHPHVIAVHHRTGDRTMDFPDDPNIKEFALQASPTTVKGLHDDVLFAVKDAKGRFHVNMTEAHPYHSNLVQQKKWDELRQSLWAVALTGTDVMLLGDMIANTPDSLRGDYRRLQRFMEATDFPGMQPHDELANGDTRWVLADPGRSYIAYADKGTGKIGLKKMVGGRYDFTWLDCVNGKTVEESGKQVADGDSVWPRPSGIGPEMVVWIRKHR